MESGPPAKLQPMIVEENLSIETVANGGWDSRIQCLKVGSLVRSYLIKTERFLLLYDTLLGPKSGEYLRARALEFAAGRPLLVVNSHADWDHYFGNMVFPEPIIGSKAMFERVCGEPGRRELALKRKEHPACYDSVELRPPTVTCENGLTLEGGDLVIELLPSKGHRPDHLALYIPQLDTLFPGDCVEDPIPLLDEESGPSSESIKELQESLSYFLRLDPQWSLPNHATPERGTAQIESNLRYLNRLTQAALQSRSLDELKALFPVSTEWGSFYQTAHQNHLRMARQQYRADDRSVRWADD